MDFVELRALGFNAQTVGFCGTLLFTTVSFRMRLLQYRTVVAKRSGESVATSSSAFGVFFFAIVLVYGVTTRRLALIYNGALLASSGAAILAGLWRFKRFRLIDWATVVAGSTTLSALLVVESLTAKAGIFGGTMLAGTVWGLAVPYELWKTKRQGAFRVEASLVAAVSTSFWIVYAFATKDRTLMVTCPVQLACIMVTLTLWFRYGGDVRTLFREYT